MSNGWKFELSEWGDGTTRLAFWDSMSGDDVIYVLNEDGSVDVSHFDENEIETRTRINLALELRRFAAEH